MFLIMRKTAIKNAANLFFMPCAELARRVLVFSKQVLQ